MAYNIIFYFSDQQRGITCGCFGQPLSYYSQSRRLAGEGVKFDNAFSPQPGLRSLSGFVPDRKISYRNRLFPQ